MIRVLVAEDQGVVREALVGLLALEPDILIVGQVGLGRETVRRTAESNPDILLLDVGLPDIDGISVSEEVFRLSPHTRILLLSAMEKPGIVHEALSRGIHGFLPKGISFAELLAGIRHVHQGQRVVPPALVTAALSAGENPLTLGERKILQLTSAGNLPSHIAGEVHLAEGTVRNKITKIIAKLSARNTMDAVRIADRMGWL